MALKGKKYEKAKEVAIRKHINDMNACLREAEEPIVEILESLKRIEGRRN